MPNILFVYYEPALSGQTTHVLSLAAGLNHHHYHVTIALPHRLWPSVQALPQVKGEVVPLPLGKVLWGPGTVLALLRLIRRRQIDIVHVHSQEAGLPMRLISRLAGVPKVIYTPQTIDIRRKNWQWLYLWLERGLAPLTHTIISVNESDRMRLIRLGITPDKIVTIPNGIDLTAFNEPADPKTLRHALGLHCDRPVVMQLGRLSPQKDPLAFVEGAAEVFRRRPEVQLVMVGEGPLRDTVAARIQELGLGESMHLLGWRPEAFRLIPAADVITLTSQWEGMPYALLEAMAWSRPVVATTVNGCPEIVGNNVTGYLVEPGDVEGWARGVVDLLDNPQKAAAMGHQGRKQVEERFSLAEMIRRVEGLYNR